YHRAAGGATAAAPGACGTMLRNSGATAKSTRSRPRTKRKLAGSAAAFTSRVGLASGIPATLRTIVATKNYTTDSTATSIGDGGGKPEAPDAGQDGLRPGCRVRGQPPSGSAPAQRALGQPGEPAFGLVDQASSARRDRPRSAP